MKTLLKTLFFIALGTVMSLISACHQENDDQPLMPAGNKSNASNTSRALPPPTPGDLRGFYDVVYNNGAEANFIFEYGNYVCCGSPTITDKLSLLGLRSSYTRDVDRYEFSLNDGINTYNYRLFYDSINSKFSGTYGIGASYNNMGTFSGVKHFTGTSGFPFLKGYWLGAYGIGAGIMNNDYTMVFEENGKVSVASYQTLYGSTAASGTYTLIGNTVIGNYTYPGGYTYSFKANCNYVSNTITGTWGYGNSNSNGGNFNLSSWNFY